jgi:D-beta-D-heptose 7-phosphate kinase/D-beta-D-heptose 1-phosphate adenosyltransferase
VLDMSDAHAIDIFSQPALEAKVKTLEELSALCDSLRVEGKTIVTNNGSYDLLHVGHVVSLHEAARQGDVLIVGVNSDESVRAYKGPHRPVNPQDHRLRMLAAVGCVDYVFAFDEETPIEFLRRLRPHVHTNGAEYGRDCIERETVESFGGRVHLLPIVEGVRTTTLIERIHRAFTDAPS